MKDKIKLYCGDCLEVMKNIPNKSKDETYFKIAEKRIAETTK